MRYFAHYNDSNILIAIGTGFGGIEITKEKYESLLIEIQEKAILTNKLYTGEITIDDIPTEWQKEIQRKVNERIIAENEAIQQEISSEEFYSMVEEVL